MLESGTQLAVYLLVTDLLEDHRGGGAGTGALDLDVVVGAREVAVRALARDPGGRVAGARAALDRRAAALGAVVRDLGGDRKGEVSAHRVLASPRVTARASRPRS